MGQIQLEEGLFPSGDGEGHFQEVEYRGQRKDGLPHGHGEFFDHFDVDDTIIVGEFKYGICHGQATQKEVRQKGQS